MWATTVGSVLGPNLVGPGKWIAERLGVAPLAGAWVLSLAGFVVAAVLLQVVLRERDPTKAIPPLAGALVKNEQDVQLLERLAFMSRRGNR